MVSNTRSVSLSLVQSTLPPSNMSSKNAAGKAMSMERGYLPLRIAIGAIIALEIREL